uniref:FH1/FH2 domain-containing protein 3-like n=2 Tax=Sinocyclocheilus anshuiensis TaxID=1608454 RepID=A0A671P5E0_9TELE
MSSFVCRVQFLDDTDPFNSTNFPEPTRAPLYTFREDIPLINQLAGVHRLLKAPHKLDDCALQLSHTGVYLDLESTLDEQRDELEGFQRGKKHSVILRTQLSVRVHACIEKLYNSNGRDLRRALFSIKQIFQDDKDLVHEFVMAEGLTCLIKVGAEADQNYQNYILRALGQIMLYVDGMNGVIGHTETIQWLYLLTGSKFRLVVKTSLKLLLVFVEYSESNAPLLIEAIDTVDSKRGCKQWSNAMEILAEKDGVDTELLVYVLTLINKTLAALPDQDSFYDTVDILEEQGIESVSQRYLGRKGTDLDLLEQLNIYEATLRHEDGDEDALPPSSGRQDRRRSSVGGAERRGLERRRSRRHSLGRSGHASPLSPASPHLSATFSTDTNDLEPDVEANLEPEETDAEAREEQEEEVEEIRAEQEVGGAEERVEEEEEGSEREAPDGEAEDSGILSDKERQNEEVNEKDNCSASSISSASSTLEREDGLNAGQWSAQSVSNEQRNKILNSKLFMLDMLYSQNKKPSEEDKDEDELAEAKERDAKEKAEDSSQDATPLEGNAAKSEGDKKVENQSNVRAFAERFGDIVKGLTSPPIETQEPPPPLPPPKKESESIWDQLMASPRDLRIGDIDFTDLGDEDDEDALDSGSLYNSGDLLAPPPPPPPCPFNLPAPPPMFSCPPPPPMFSIRVPPPPPCFSIQAPPPPQQQAEQPPLFQKRKKTIRLFWSEVRPADWIYRNHKRSQESLWSRLEPVKLDTAKLEHLFESKSKEMPVTKKTAADGKRQEIIILDSKRSNSINIGLTVLPPPRTIKTAILSFDEYALNKEGIEKILMMIPTEEETQKIQEAQLANPDIPLGSAEQFLLTLSSISELSARLQLWAFKLDYEATEKEVAEPLQDLKEGMDQLEKNKTLRFILSTLLAIGNLLNGSNAKGFDLTYLEKVPEVKDTVHKQSLLHHVCSIVVENFPDGTDLYSEIGAVTRSAKVDFDQLQETLTQMEWRCKASWDHLKVIAKHEMKPALKQKMSDFLKDCAERIIILKTVHRRIMNRFHWFLLFLRQPAYSVREISVTRFSKLLSEFALEYRTTRERVLQQRQKRADHRERNKTRGKMITDLSTQPQGLCHAKDTAEHEQMKAVLKSSLQRGDSDSTSTGMTGLRTRTRTRASRGRSAWAAGNEESQCATDDAADEIMERIVRSATQSPRERAQPRERRRSRANRKSLRRTLKGGLTAEEAQALGLDTTEAH